MPTFIPKWPQVQDSAPLFADNLSPVSAQWFNNAQTLVQVLEAELGVDIVSWPTRKLLDVLDQLLYTRQAGVSALGKMRGLSRLVGSGSTHTTLGSGTHTITFSLLTPEDVPNLGVEAYVHLGTVLEPSDSRGGIINGHPFTDPTSPFIHDPAIQVSALYIVQGAWSNGGVMSGAGTPTHHHVIWGLREFQ